MKIDWTILQWIQRHTHCKWMDKFMTAITHLGDLDAVWFAAAAALLCSKKYRKNGLYMLAGMALSALIGNALLKNIIRRERPCWVDPEHKLLVPNPSDYSFPSGHTLSSVAAATILAKTNPQMGKVAIPLAGTIAFSRLYLYLHYPSDVVGGIILGAAMGELTMRGAKHLEQKNRH